LFRPWARLRLVVLAGGLGLAGLAPGADPALAGLTPVAGGDGGCHVLRVVDGDTVTLYCPGWGRIAARLTGFDAPEIHAARCLAEQVAAEHAAQALHAMIRQAAVLEVIVQGTDRFSRVLVALMLDGENVAQRMIREGHARPYGGGQRGGWC